MERKCMKCNAGMKKALLSANGGYVLAEEIKKGFNRNVSTVDTYVCPKCGYIEMYAEKPEIFDK
jgi:rubrerythrin